MGNQKQKMLYDSYPDRFWETVNIHLDKGWSVVSGTLTTSVFSTKSASYPYRGVFYVVLEKGEPTSEGEA